MYVCSTFPWSLISPAHRHRLQVCCKTQVSNVSHIMKEKNSTQNILIAGAHAEIPSWSGRGKDKQDTGCDTCMGALLDLLQPREFPSLFAAGHSTPPPCAHCSGNPYVPPSCSQAQGASVHLYPQTKLSSYIAILQIRGLLYHNFKAL